MRAWRGLRKQLDERDDGGTGRERDAMEPDGQARFEGGKVGLGRDAFRDRIAHGDGLGVRFLDPGLPERFGGFERVEGGVAYGVPSRRAPGTPARVWMAAVMGA